MSLSLSPCVPGLSLCTVCCTQTPLGARFRLPTRWPAPLVSSSPPCLGIWKAGGDPCLVSDCDVTVFLFQWHTDSDSFTGLLCGPPWDVSFLCGVLASSPGIGAEEPGRHLVGRSFQHYGFAGNQCFVLNVACKCICNSYRIYYLYIQAFCQLYMINLLNFRWVVCLIVRFLFVSSGFWKPFKAILLGSIEIIRRSEVVRLWRKWFSFRDFWL